MKYQNNYLSLFEKKGYFVVKDFIKNDISKKIIYETLNSKGTIKYFDRLGNPRRIEKIYNKGKYINNLNKKIVKFLFNNLNEKFNIFKDKFNLKPPHGEGFFAHYDGVFIFNTKKKKNIRGWYEYDNFFVNTLIALDNCNSKNGTIELGKSDNLPFHELIKNTKKNGTPDLKKIYEKKIKFRKLNLRTGDMVVFKNTCPHRSGKNYTRSPRRILYFTYNLKKNGNFYKKYFLDKKISMNKTQKALSGNIR